MTSIFRTTSAKVQVLASFVAISFVIGLIFRNVLIFAGVTVLIYLGLISLQSQPPREIKIQRLIEKAQLFEDDVSKVRLQATNSSKRSIALVTVEDSVPQGARITITLQHSASPSNREKHEIISTQLKQAPSGSSLSARYESDARTLPV